MLQDGSFIEYARTEAELARRAIRTGGRNRKGALNQQDVVALAIKMEKLVRERQVSDYAALVKVAPATEPGANVTDHEPNEPGARRSKMILLFLPKTAKRGLIRSRSGRAQAYRTGAVGRNWQKKLFRNVVSAVNF